MTVTRRTATTRSANTTESTVQRNGTTARQRVQIEAKKARADYLARLADAEKEGRTVPISATVAGYDGVTGDFLLNTPDGGTIRARNLSTGAPTGVVPVQRFPGSQRATFNALPSNGDQGAILAQIEGAQRDIVGTLPPILRDTDPGEDDRGRFDRDQWVNNLTGAAFIWNAEGDEWIEISGGRILYGQGDPNLIANGVPWQPNAQYYDTRVRRLYIASSPEDELWWPAAPHTFDTTTLALADHFYLNDMYQGPTDHGIEDAEGGMFYRLGPSGWVPQFSCCPEVPEPPDPPCTIGGYNVTHVVDPTNPGGGIWYSIVRWPCS